MKRHSGKNRTRPILTVLVGVALVLAGSSARAVVWYVDQAATGPGHDGLSWCTAFLNPSEALQVAVAGDTIRVANGTYTPNPTGLANPREATFALVSGTALEGGYAGCGAPNPDTRHFGLYETILSGDLNDDDGPDYANNGDNAFHVATIEDANATTKFTGFVVAAGNSPVYGSGLFVHGASPIVEYCSFVRNAGSSALLIDSEPSLSPTNPTIRNCVFAMNRARGVRNQSEMERITNCTFYANELGGMFSRGNTDVVNCLFYANGNAGLKVDDFSHPNVVNCAFLFNYAGPGKCGIGLGYGFFSSGFVLNCILWGNSDMNPSTDLEHEQACGVFWAYNTNWQGHGAVPESGIIDADPLFVDADGADDVIGTGDDDYRLQLASPCIDSGDNAFLPAGVDTDLVGKPRLIDGDEDGFATVDMGPYEAERTSVPPSEIPSVSEWGLVALLLGFLAAAKVRFRSIGVTQFRPHSDASHAVTGVQIVPADGRPKGSSQRLGLRPGRAGVIYFFRWLRALEAGFRSICGRARRPSGASG